MAQGGIPLSEFSGSGATRELHETIRDFNRATGEQTRTIIRLTRWILALTVVMTVAVIVQIIVALVTSSPTNH
jgi:hypothetical protein